MRCIVLGLHFNTAGHALDYQQGVAAKAAQQQCATGTTALLGLAMRMNALRQGPATEHPAQEPRSPRAPNTSHAHAPACRCRCNQQEKPHPSLHAVSTDTMAHAYHPACHRTSLTLSNHHYQRSHHCLDPGDERKTVHRTAVH